MSHYFLQKDGLQSGPLTLLQLRDISIDEDTLVWHEGENGMVPVLNVRRLIDNIMDLPLSPTQESDTGSVNQIRRMLRATKGPRQRNNIKLFVLVMLLMGVVLYTYNGLMEEKYAHLEERIAELNQTIEAQQELTAIMLRQQEQIDAARQVAANMQQIESKASYNALANKVLEKEYNEALTALVIEKEKMQDVREFRLFRSGAQRDKEEAAQQKKIDSWTQEAARISGKLNKQ